MRAGASFAFDHHHPVRAPQVIVKCLRPGQRALVVRPGQQVMDEITAQPQFRVGDAAQPGQLHREHGRTMLKGNLVGIVRSPVGIYQRDDPDQVGPRRHEQDQPFAVPHGFAFPHQPAEQVLTLGERLLRVGLGPARACPGGQVAVPVLDRDRHAGELVQGFRYAQLALTRDRHAGEAVVDVHAALQPGHRLGERGIGDGEFCRGAAFAGVQPGVRYGNTSLLRDHLDKESLLGGQLPLAGRDHVAKRSADAAQRVGPRPDVAGQLYPARAAAQRGKPPGQSTGYVHAAVMGRTPAAIGESVAHDPPGAEPRRRRGGEFQDLVLADQLGHQQRDHQQCPELA